MDLLILLTKKCYIQYFAIIRARGESVNLYTMERVKGDMIFIHFVFIYMLSQCLGDTWCSWKGLLLLYLNNITYSSVKNWRSATNLPHLFLLLLNSEYTPICISCQCINTAFFTLMHFLPLCIFCPYAFLPLCTLC